MGFKNRGERGDIKIEKKSHPEGFRSDHKQCHVLGVKLIYACDLMGKKKAISMLGVGEKDLKTDLDL